MRRFGEYVRQAKSKHILAVFDSCFSGSLFALVRLEGGSAQALSERLIDGPGLLLLPGTALGSDDRHVRFGLGRRDFAACLERLDAFLGHELETRVEV